VKRFLLILIVIAFLSFGVLAAIVLFQNRNGITTVDATTTSRVYGVVRATADGTWVLLSNSSHAPYNIASISQTGDYVVVTYNPTFTKVHYSAITPDDSLVITNRDVGASVGLHESYVYIAQDGVKVNPSTVTSPGANFWFYMEGEY